MIHSDELLAVAKRIFCFGTPEEALGDPAPGILDQSSWVKWNERYNCIPVPPFPRRQIPGVDPTTVPDFFPSRS